MFKEYRKILKLKPADVVLATGVNDVTGIYYLEKSYRTNKLFNYLLLLRSKGADINDFIDAVINEDFPQYVNEFTSRKESKNSPQKGIEERLKKFEDRLKKLEKFEEVATLKFKIDLEIEKTEEEILKEEKNPKLK